MRFLSFFQSESLSPDFGCFIFLFLIDLFYFSFFSCLFWIIFPLSWRPHVRLRSFASPFFSCPSIFLLPNRERTSINGLSFFLALPITMMFFLVFEPSVTQSGSIMANSFFLFSSSHSAVLTERSYDPCHHSKLIKPSGILLGPVPFFLHDLDGFFLLFFLFIFLTVRYWGASILDCCRFVFDGS